MVVTGFFCFHFEGPIYWMKKKLVELLMLLFDLSLKNEGRGDEFVAPTNFWNLCASLSVYVCGCLQIWNFVLCLYVHVLVIKCSSISFFLEISFYTCNLIHLISNLPWFIVLVFRCTRKRNKLYNFCWGTVYRFR